MMCTFLLQVQDSLASMSAPVRSAARDEYVAWGESMAMNARKVPCRYFLPLQLESLQMVTRYQDMAENGVWPVPDREQQMQPQPHQPDTHFSYVRQLASAPAPPQHYVAPPPPGSPTNHQR